MGGMEQLGPFEQIVLMALLRLGANAYGVPIRHEISRRTGKDVSVGALYTTLDRLERKGYISSRMGEPTAERGGKAKKYFKIEALGSRAIKSTFAQLGRMAEGLSHA